MLIVYHRHPLFPRVPMESCLRPSKHSTQVVVVDDESKRHGQRGAHGRTSHAVLPRVLQGKPVALAARISRPTEARRMGSLGYLLRHQPALCRPFVAPSCDRKVVWIHDYNLMLVPWYLRQKGFAGTISFFFHTTVPRAMNFKPSRSGGSS